MGRRSRTCPRRPPVQMSMRRSPVFGEGEGHGEIVEGSLEVSGEGLKGGMSLRGTWRGARRGLERERASYWGPFGVPLGF